MCYTPDFLWDVGLQTYHNYHKFYINPDVRSRIISLVIRRRPANKTYRRTRAGKNIFHKTERMVTNQHFPFLIRSQTAPRLHNLCQICRYSSIHMMEPTISHTSARAICNKIKQLQEYITEVGIEICAITETWIKSDDSLTPVGIPPPRYKILYKSRTEDRGGVALVCLEDLIISEYPQPQSSKLLKWQCTK